MPTARLYFDDPLTFEFDAKVVRHGRIGESPTLVLDRSAFYPEGGGQLADRGSLGELSVIDVQVDETGDVHHLVEGELPAAGVELVGRIDVERRRLHMAEHTGQHVLSRALLEEAGAETVSARLGESACTIDLDRSGLDEASLARAERLASSVVDADLTVRAFFPDPAELATLALRREPKVSDEIRVVTIGSFDATPCGGTHATHTSQIGLLTIVGSERYKGGTRVTFTAGAKSRELLLRESSVLRAMAKAMSSGPLDVPAALDKLRRELEEVRGELGRMRSAIAERSADELLARAEREGADLVVACIESATPELLRNVGARLGQRAGTFVVLATSDSTGHSVYVTRGSGSSLDAGAYLKELARRTGGKGGGRPERAEGRVPAQADFSAVARAVLSAFRT